MFERKKCENCQSGVKDSWSYCPFCGESLATVDKELRKVQKDFEGLINIPKIFNMPVENRDQQKSEGVYIKILSGHGEPPKIEIRSPSEFRGSASKNYEEHKRTKSVASVRKPPKLTVEPETQIKKNGPMRVVILKLDDVKKKEDVEVRKLENSIEIRAYAGDKLYFTLIPLLPAEEFTSEKFENGNLILEFKK